MPHKDWNLKATWDAAYSFGVEGDTGHPNTRPEVRLHYHRFIKRPDAVIHAEKFAAALGWVPPGPPIVIVGAGFGWTDEALEDLGFDRVVGLDLSTYIQDNHGGTEESEIDAEIAAVGLDPAVKEGATLKAKLFDGGTRGRSTRGVKNESGKNGASRGRIKQALGLSGNQKVDWVLTEAILESLDDTEAAEVSTIAYNYANNVAHFIYPLRPTQDSGFNWKTLEDWKALLPADTFIEAGTYRVL